MHLGWSGRGLTNVAWLCTRPMKSQGQLRQGVNGSVPLCTPLLGRDPAKPTRVSQYHVRDQIHRTQTTTTGQTLFSPLLAILVHITRMDESAVHAL